MLSDHELQSLQNRGSESEAAAQEILRLRRDLMATESLALKAQTYADERLANAVAAERERCASLCREYAVQTSITDFQRHTAGQLAAAIEGPNAELSGPPARR